MFASMCLTFFDILQPVRAKSEFFIMKKLKQ